MPYRVLALLLLCTTVLGGCTEGVLDPKGPIASAERQIIFNSLGIMLAIVIPTILATAGIAFWFRSSNARAHYRPDFIYSGRLELLVWSIPTMTVLLVGGVAWVGAHKLDPRKAIDSTVTPLNIQVASLNWKWLFIYPKLGVASVNHLTVPVGTPISFELTSSGVMNSFFVPQLGGQIYTMSGMTTHLQLQGDYVGTYPGLSSNFSGEGFADMHFDVDVVTTQQFDQWVATARRNGPVLDPAALSDLARPSLNVTPFTYRSVTPDLFSDIVGSTISMDDSHSMSGLRPALQGEKP